jgi:RNA polymerase sigma-70 factor (ECF subfamily)
MTKPAAGDVFERHHLVVFRFLRRMTDDASLAEDLTQEVFLRVVRSFESYEDRSRERSWVFRIARNLLADRHRERERSPHDVPLDEAYVTRHMPTQGLRVALQQALAGLAVDDREAFLLREVGGLSYDEIADATGGTRDAARMRIYRARLALREALGPSRPARLLTATEASK